VDQSPVGVERATPLVRRFPSNDAVTLTEREWLVTNGLGGYASGTIGGAATRRYHGLLIAAHPAPLGRIMLLNHLTEEFQCPDQSLFPVGGYERVGGMLEVHGVETLDEFRLEMGLPVWQYAAGGQVIEKRVFMPYQRNTVHITYRLLSGDGPVRLRLRLSLHFRGHDEAVNVLDDAPYTVSARGGCYEIRSQRPGYPPLRLSLQGASPSLTLADATLADVLYRVEEGRGYDNVGTLWSPGVFSVMLPDKGEVTLTASTEAWEQIQAITPAAAWNVEMERRQRLLVTAGAAAGAPLTAELTLAADQFIILPAGRVQDLAVAQATGDQARTMIAGYHWFTDWGRDTMISLEGLTLVTGRHAEAGYILRTFAHHVRDGLIPNFFPDHATDGLYHTADATLWFFHALHRYVEVTHDQQTLQALLPVLREIVACHQQGTRFGIGVDAEDGLLRQGAEGYQLTWMDAKVGDWVVTPRRGKAVEINALWYNALRLLEGWLRTSGTSADNIAAQADRTYTSFNERFWCEAEHGLFDVIDGEQGDDSACRPNQVLAISLEHPVLDPAHWKTVLETVSERLLTPVGLRTLAPGHPDYEPKYSGDLRSRDAAYHQGTVWAWLIGPFIDAWCRVYPDRRNECAKFLAGFEAHLSEACLGTISEIFDAEAPFTARGCAAQAWSVAEVLRTAMNVMPRIPDTSTTQSNDRRSD
jgi:predicted glycogen debranching enzyme